MFDDIPNQRNLMTRRERNAGLLSLRTDRSNSIRIAMAREKHATDDDDDDDDDDMPPSIQHLLDRRFLKFG